MPAAVKCPYFKTMSRDKRYATITCMEIENHLGFDIKNQIVFDAYEEQRNYAGIFCCDIFDACPYFRAIYRYQQEKESKNEKKKEFT